MRKLILLVLLLTTAFGIFLLLKNEGKLQIVPVSDEVLFDTYHETLPDSFSFSSAKQKDGEIYFNYRLTTAQEEPFSGLFFYQKDSSKPYFEASAYDQVLLDLTADKAQRIPITFTLNYPGFTDSVKELGNMPFTYLLELKKGRNSFRIDISDFTIPSWWLRYHQKEKEDFPLIDRSRVNYFVIGTCQLLGGGIDDEIIVHDFALSHSNIVLKGFLLGAVLLLILVFVFYRIKSNRKIVAVPIYQTDTKQRKDAKSLIIEYVGSHYQEATFSQTDLENAIGVRAREIGEVLKKEFNCNFKSYLNLVRLTEVKRLLLETDLSVSEIAYQCGYGNISHFNRVFKQHFNQSPKEYRDTKQKED